MTLPASIQRRTAAAFARVAATVGRQLDRVLQPSMRRVHDAVVESLFPTGAQPGEAPADLDELRRRIWSTAHRPPALRVLLAVMSRLSLLTSPRLVRAYARLTTTAEQVPAATRQAALAELAAMLDGHGGRRAVSFADLPLDGRRRLVAALLHSPLAIHRRIGLGLWIFYVLRIYEGAAGRRVAQIAEPAVSQWTPDPRIRPQRFASHLRYRSRGDRLEGDIDHLIVGSGPAGCVVAHELQRAGRRVLVVESGSFFMPGTWDARGGLEFYESRGMRSTADGSIFVLNGEVVGGGATINVDMAFSATLPIVQARIERWREAGMLPPDLWTPQEIARADAWIASRLGTRQVARSEINAHNQRFLDGSTRHGLTPSLYRLNTYPDGRSPFVRTDKRGPVEALLIPAMSAPRCPASILPDARVTRVVIEHGRAVGVELRTAAPRRNAGIVVDPSRLGVPPGTRLRVMANNIILCAGNLGSSALLLGCLSNPHVGRGFVMHPFMLAIGVFDDIIDGHLGLSSSVYAADYITTDFGRPQPDFLLEVAAARPEILASMCPGSPEQVHDLLRLYRRLGGLGVVLLDSVHPDNRVVLDRWGAPEVRYALSEADKARFRRGVAEGVRILFEAGARRVLLPTWEPITNGNTAGFLDDISEADLVEQHLQFTPNQTPLFAAHMMAGNKMSTRPDRGVVAPDCTVWGVAGLHVVDGSIFPSSVGVNPMQCIYTVAKIFADRHLANQ